MTQDTYLCENPQCSFREGSRLTFCPGCRGLIIGRFWSIRRLLGKWPTFFLLLVLFFGLMYSPSPWMLQLFFLFLIFMGIMLGWSRRSTKGLGLLYSILAIMAAYVFPMEVGLITVLTFMVIVTSFVLLSSTLQRFKWSALAMTASLLIWIESRDVNVDTLPSIVEQLKLVYEHPSVQNVRLLLLGLTVVRFATLAFAACLVFGVFRSIPGISFSRIWPVLPKRVRIPSLPEISAGANHRLRHVVILGSAWTMIEWTLNKLLAISIGVCELVWIVLYWTLYSITLVGEMVVRSVLYVGRLLWHAIVEVFLQCAGGAWWLIGYGMGVLMSIGIPLMLASVTVDAIVKCSSVSIASLSGREVASTFIWYVAMSATAIVWLRFGEWLISPTESPAWWRQFVPAETVGDWAIVGNAWSPLEVWFCAEADSRRLGYFKATDNFVEGYIMQRIIVGAALGLLGADCLGSWLHWGPFRFGIAAALIGTLCLGAGVVVFLTRSAPSPE